MAIEVTSVIPPPRPAPEPTISITGLTKQTAGELRSLLYWLDDEQRRSEFPGLNELFRRLNALPGELPEGLRAVNSLNIELKKLAY